MTLLKRIFGSGRPSKLDELESAYADATSKLADTELDLFISLMQVYDPAIRKEDLDMKRLHSFVLASTEASQAADDFKTFELGGEAFSDKAWQVRFIGLRILQGLGMRLAPGTRTPDSSAQAGRKGISVQLVIDRMKAGMNDPDERIRDATKNGIGSIEIATKFPSNN